MKLILIICLFNSFFLFAQKTEVQGVVLEEETGKPIPLADVFFQDAKIGTLTDDDGYYKISTYYATDTLIIRAFGFTTIKVAVKIDKFQELNFKLQPITQTTDEVEILAPKEKPSTVLHKRIVRNKPINNKLKLEAYEYEVYNKIQLDLNNIGEGFDDRKIVQRLDLIINYLDTLDGDKYLPLILSESLSDFYYRTNPKKKKEIINASRITGIENLELNHFLGDMYQDINVYDNYIGIFDKSFISPIANFARSHYNFYLKDSAFIDRQWCYLMTFTPKRRGGLTFEGEMWIHDTTYAVKKWSANVSITANVNYVNGFYLEQSFEQVEPEVWMLVDDRLIVDLKITKGTKILGFYGRKRSMRKNFVINKPRPVEFYNSNNNVEVSDSANKRNEDYWKKNRHAPLSNQEQGIDIMIDSLQSVPIFILFKDLSYLVTTGFYRLGQIEVGNIKNIVGYNRVEGFRTQLQLRTSNDFSRKIELSGKIAYGFDDQKFKYGGGVRLNVTPQKRGLLNLNYDYDVKQLGMSEEAANMDIDESIGALIRTKPQKELMLVENVSAYFEKDIGESFIVKAGTQWKELSRLGITKFIVPQPDGLNNILRIRTFETSLKVRYAKNEEFISGAFDRISVGSNYPIISLEGTIGIKGVFNSDYSYRKLEFDLSHSPRLGIFGTLYYGVYAGVYFGTAAYPFLKIHEGSQTYWYQSNAYNRMYYFEFISDRYVGIDLEHHFNGFIMNSIPLINKLKWRLVIAGKSVLGDISDKQTQVMLLPNITRYFNEIPYFESSIGIENIFKVMRIDAVWRMTHKYPGMSPLGIRVKLAVRF